MRHGGDLGAARRLLGDDVPEPAGGWLDLSTGINPTSYPFTPPGPANWQRLPEPGQEAKLLALARAAYNVGDRADICAAPGTQILIQLAARLGSGPVAVVGPTYSEHAAASAGEGRTVTTVASLAAARDAAAIIVVNPNNPDGRIVPPAELMPVARELARRRGLLVVDEAFADVAPEVSVARAAGRRGLLILRSFGKFYGLAGVRLGFAIGAAADVRRIAAWLGPWAVSGPAIAIGQEALADRRWAGDMRAEVRRRAGDLARMLACHGLRIVGDAGLFVLVEHPKATAIHGLLAQQGVWTRRFDAMPQWLRFGLPPGKAIGRLDEALDRAMRALDGASP